MSRHCWRYFLYSVECTGCDWTVCGKTGLGLAAQHHDRTGHSVRVEVEGCISYLSEEDHQARLAEKGPRP